MIAAAVADSAVGQSEGEAKAAAASACAVSPAISSLRANHWSVTCNNVVALFRRQLRQERARELTKLLVSLPPPLPFAG